MFEDSLLESGNRFKGGRRKITTVISFLVQTILVGILIVLPLLYTQALPNEQLTTLLIAPPPPPPPPPGSAAPKPVKVQSDILNGALRTPTKIPEKVEMIKESAATMASTGGVVGGVVGGVPGGVLGGQVGGVIGGILSSVPVAVPRVAVPDHQRVSQGVMQGMLVHQVMPSYPLLAKQARIQGTVVLQAQISKNGSIENLKVVQGHPMLAPAAVEAVKQWKYKPYYLNGEPVEVDTLITVNFTLAGSS